jgi:transcriptional regulator NrdR family protein
MNDDKPEEPEPDKRLCPRCGCAWTRVLKTEELSRCVRRHRQCNHCGKRYSVREDR